MSFLKLIERMGVSPKGFLVWVPDSNTKTLEKILTEPLDVIYIVRPQVERWTNEELKMNSNLESARKELEKRERKVQDD